MRLCKWMTALRRVHGVGGAAREARCANPSGQKTLAGNRPGHLLAALHCRLEVLLSLLLSAAAAAPLGCALPNCRLVGSITTWFRR